MSKQKSEYIEYPMPTGPVWDALAKQHMQLQKNPQYLFAKSCVHCNDIADSFNRWVSTYCHEYQTNIQDNLSICDLCPHYQKRN